MTLTYEQWVEIIRSVNSNEGDILEQIKKNLEEQDKGTSQEWEAKNFDINHLVHTGIFKTTLLHLAIEYKKEEIAKYLIKHKADPNAQY
ncbi:hypothetical protein GOM44_04635, partial [Wolbachia endosymbiont of Atemnus politus]|nr:hypothetical protein [Wolbachia endosymbiont of Atemnus politus]